MTKYIITACFFISGILIHSQEDNRPNVILIMCDDLNDYEGVFGGHEQAITPNIDRLANNGIKFINAQTNAPVCQPSRNSLFTGVYPHTSKDFGWTPLLKQSTLKNNKTIIRLFKENGYLTLGTGKLTHGKPPKDWQKWGNNHKHNYGPLYFDGEKPGALPTVPQPYQSIGAIDGSYGRLSEGGITDGKTRKVPGFIYGWDFKPFRYINDNDRSRLQDEKHAIWASKQIMSMDAEGTETPFFMGIGFVRPHTPLHAPDKYFDMYPLESLKLDDWLKGDEKDTYWSKNFDSELKGPRYYRTLLKSYNGNRELAMKKFLQAYLACITFIDDQVGVILDTLVKSRFKDNTIIVFTSDHGWQMGEKNYLFKNSPWEESAKVPLIISSPSQKNGRKEDQPVALIDIFPTLVDYCNLEGNHKLNANGGSLGGFSMKPLIEGNSKWEGPKGALTIVGNVGANTRLNEQTFSYRTKRYRYILYPDGNEELYDHDKDPREWENIADIKKMKSIKKKLKKDMYKIINAS